MTGTECLRATGGVWRRCAEIETGAPGQELRPAKAAEGRVPGLPFGTGSARAAVRPGLFGLRVTASSMPHLANYASARRLPGRQACLFLQEF